jgi:hypothetical protein
LIFPNEADFGFLTSRTIEELMYLLSYINKFEEICYSSHRILIHYPNHLWLNNLVSLRRDILWILLAFCPTLPLWAWLMGRCYFLPWYPSFPLTPKHVIELPAFYFNFIDQGIKRKLKWLVYLDHHLSCSFRQS